MKIVFAEKRLALIRTDRAHELGLPVRVIKGAREKLNFLAEAPDERTIRNWKSLNYKRLEGSDDHRQIRINDQYRITFAIDTDCERLVITIFAIGDPIKGLIMDAHTYLGDVPHPGFYIREELEAREWTQRDLAYILGTPEQAVNMIISGKRGISPEMAKALGQAFDVNPDLFANLQRAYDMARAREPDPSVGRRARLQSAYPVREMIKRNWLEDTDAAMLEVQMAQFFGVATANDIPHLQHAARKSSYYGGTPPAQLAWLFRVRQIAKTLIVGRYSERDLCDALPRLRALMADPEESRHVARMLLECGVRLIFVEGLPNAKIDGACFWLDKNAPVVGLSLRYDRIDNFWFVLRHEIEHVLRKHGQDKEIIDVDIYGEPASGHLPPEEIAANAAAADFCIPRAELDAFIARKAPFFAERDVIGFARRLNVHPGLVVGQIQKRTQRWDFLRRHLAKVRVHVLPGAIVDGWGVPAPVEM